MTERVQDRRRRLAAARQRLHRARLKNPPGGAADAPATAKADPPADETPSAWIERTCTVPSGPHRGEPLRLYRWQRHLVDALDTRITVLRMAAQAGKTAVLLGVLAHRLRRGTAGLLVAPDAGSGLALTRRRVERQIASCPELAALAQVARSAALGESARSALRTFRHGASIRTAGAVSPTQLSSEDAETVIGDELARWPTESGSEGDPVLLCEARTEAYRATRLVLLASTPVVDTDLCAKWSAAGDVRRWHVSCAGCAHVWSPAWADVDASTDVSAIVCPQCHHHHADGPARLALLDTGEWRATQDAPDPGVASYVLPRWLSPASSLADCVAARTRAERTRALASWHRLVAAEPAEPDPPVDLQDIRRRLVAPGPDWPPGKVTAVACGVDLQGNRVEVLTLARLDTGLLCVLDYARFFGRPGTAADDRAWGELRRHARENGARVVLIDSGWNPDMARAQYRRFRWCIPIKGMGGPRPTVDRGRRELILGVDTLKGIVHSRFLGETLLVPAGADFVTDHFLRSLFSETEESTPNGARKWVKHYERNEVLDCCAYALAGLECIPARQSAPLRLTPLAA